MFLYNISCCHHLLMVVLCMLLHVLHVKKLTFLASDRMLPLEPSEARKVKVRLFKFTVLNDELYKRGFLLPYLKCLNSEDVMYVLREVHERICGNHSGPRSLVGKVVRAGYLWPTMQKDVVKVI